MGILETNNGSQAGHPAKNDLYNFISICNFLREVAVSQGPSEPGRQHNGDGSVKRRISVAVLQNGIPIPGRRQKKPHPARNLQQLLEEAIRNLLLLYRGTLPQDKQAGKLSHPHMHTILLIYEEVRECPNIKVQTLTYFAHKYALSPSTLKRSFKNILQMTIHKFISYECMKKAIKLREDNKLTLGEIAEVLGYSDKSGFVRTLKRYEKQFPST